MLLAWAPPGLADPPWAFFAAMKARASHFITTQWQQSWGAGARLEEEEQLLAPVLRHKAHMLRNAALWGGAKAAQAWESAESCLEQRLVPNQLFWSHSLATCFRALSQCQKKSPGLPRQTHS